MLHTPAGGLPCSYLVQYPGPAADLNAWNRHYNTHHPPIMAKFPGVRAIEIYTRIDWVSGLDWPREDAMQRNKLLFDSPAALSAGLTPEVLREMRADFIGSRHLRVATRTTRWRRGSSGRVGRNPLPPVLLVCDLLHPVDRLAVQLFLNRDVAHGGGRAWRRASASRRARTRPRRPAGFPRPARPRAAPSRSRTSRTASGRADACARPSARRARR